MDQLTIIGERINPGFTSSRRLIEQRDLAGIAQLAIEQTQRGAGYLTINVGDRAQSDPSLLRDVIKAVQNVTSLPLAFDYPSRDVQALCLQVYDPARANGAKPIMNSVSELRWDMLDLAGVQPFKVVLMASERVEDGRPMPNRTAEQVHQTARRMVERVMARDPDMTLGDLYVDVSIGPIATDSEGLTRMAVDAIRLIGSDPQLAGVHMLVGLSNLSIMLPSQAVDGSPLKPQVESAFLTLTVPHGLDTILGTPGRSYRMLEQDHPVLVTFRRILESEGFDAVVRVQDLYQPLQAQSASP